MKYNWKEVEFGNFATFKYGKMVSQKQMKEDGEYPVYSGYKITGHFDEYNVDKGKLIIVARGIGGTGDVKITKEKCFLTNISIVADIDEKVAEVKYLYYMFQQHNLRYLDSGSAQSQITISDLKKVKMKLPPISKQKQIINLLNLLDEKIELNNKINNNLILVILIPKIKKKAKIISISKLIKTHQQAA